MNRRSLWLSIAWVLLGLACLALGWTLRALQAPEWEDFHKMSHPAGLRPWMVEADCYSQLARVQRILEGKGLIQNHFTVENWPEGLVPSTTAPFDYCILLLYAPLKLFTAYPLDWAGALVSPFLWLVLVLFWMFFRSREFSRAGRAFFLIGSTALPAFVFATECGRPRHQSLILLLLALGLTAEYERWHLAITPRRAWSIFAGIVWGLACWTSLFEPPFVLAVLLLFNFVVRRRESFAFLISYGFVMLFALLLEGFHIFIPPAEYAAPLANWLATIGEVRGLDFAQIAHQMTAGLLILPFVAWALWTRKNFDRTDRMLIVLTFLLTLFTIFQSRWIYYATLGELLVIVRFYQLALTHWTRWIVLVVFLLGLGESDDRQLEASAASSPAQPSFPLFQISRSIDQPGGIMAPWWLSPGLLYFSGQPIVTGSSHCGISGIVDGAKFYTSTSWVEAERILQKRHVRWVVVFDDPRLQDPLLNTSLETLGLPRVSDDDPPEKAAATIAETLINGRFVPTWMQLRSVTSWPTSSHPGMQDNPTPGPELKLYEYVPRVEK